MVKRSLCLGVAACVLAGCFEDSDSRADGGVDAGTASAERDSGTHRRDAGPPGVAPDGGSFVDSGVGAVDAAIDAGIPICLGTPEAGAALLYDVAGDRLLRAGQTRFEGRVTGLSDTDALPAAAETTFEAEGLIVDELRWVRIGSATGADWVIATVGVPLGFGVAKGSAVSVRLDQNPLRLASSDQLATVEIDVGTEHAFFFHFGRVLTGEVEDGVSLTQAGLVCNNPSASCGVQERFLMELTIGDDSVVLREGRMEAVGAHDAWHWMSALNPSRACAGSFINVSAVAFAHRTPLFVAPGAGCETSAFSTFTGANMELDPGPCDFSLAEAQAGISFGYAIVVDSNQVNVHPSTTGGYSCPQEGPSGLFVEESIGGGAQKYCVCDVGLCGPGSLGTTTVVEGTHPATFDWTGHNWNGPSDTNEALGAPFPAGTYVFRAAAHGIIGSGTGPLFEVSVARAFTLH